MQPRSRHHHENVNAPCSRHERTARTPIIALTANVQPYQIERCRAAGMNGHVGKPIRAADLIAAMQAALEQGADDGAEEQAA